jgi:hypothetical protein
MPSAIENVDIDNPELHSLELAGFDEFIAAGMAPWLVARVGDVVPTAISGQAALPQDALDVPQLDTAFMPNMLSGARGDDWFIPEFTLLADADPAFALAVVQTGEIADDEGPFNRATLTLTLRAVRPKNLTENPALAQLPQVPDLTVEPVLVIPVKAQDGSTKTNEVTGTAVARSDGEFVATFELVGSIVEFTYLHLTTGGKAELRIKENYTAFQTTVVRIHEVGEIHDGRDFQGFQFDLYGDGGITPGGTLEPLDPSLRYRFFPVTARFTRTIPVGLTFNTDAYRARYTITADDMTRPIIDIADLHQFARARSEYRELTTLGDVAAKYPSLRRLYFGQVSGTVVAVPAAYGIVRGAEGLLASCDSIVDDSPVTVTGCRFHFTFTVAPMADPVDLARLRADIVSIPEAAGRTLRVILPAGLDARHASSLDGFSAGTAVFADAQDSAVQVGVDIADDQGTPATTNVNLFLQQLAATGPAPLFGNIAIRLDDAFAEPVRTPLVLNLRQTTGRGDLAVSVQAGTAQAADQGPFDLVLHRFAAVQGHQVTVTSLGDQVLPVGKSTPLGSVAEGTSVEVSYGLPVPVPLPKAAMSKYVAFHTHTVQEVQHPLTVNATGLDLVAMGITTIEVQITLTGNPAEPVPAMTLSPSHLIDFVHVMVPVDSAVTGLDSTVALTRTSAAGSRTVTVPHDFVEEPILVLTPSMIA